MSVIERAKEIAIKLSDADIAEKARAIASDKAVFVQEEQKNYDNEPMSSNNLVIAQIAALDLARLTPLEAINLLYQYQEEIAKR